MNEYKKLIFFKVNDSGMIGGLPIIDLRNKEVFSHFAENTYCLQEKVRRWTKLKSYFYFVWKTEFHIICSQITDPKSTFLFVSHSLYGKLIKKIKKKLPTVKIYVFFHNVEAKLACDNNKNKKGLLNKIGFHLKKHYLNESERLSVLYSDMVFTLTERDRQDILKLYEVKGQIIVIPTSLNDTYNPDLQTYNLNKPLKLLFVGTRFGANEDAVVWLAQRISPFVNATFHIVGNRMDELSAKLKQYNNIVVTGKVSNDELSKYYYESDVFISTLFKGGGMKTKIAEAMMYGLPVIGTKESFIGYEFDHNLIGINTDDEDEIIRFIDKLDKNRDLLKVMSMNSRDIFVNRYSILQSVSYIGSALVYPLSEKIYQNANEKELHSNINF
ncbi:MAG: glycosyltransferase family 4 protein [Paludibacter sp.]|nr:glycosyltransferase family 4 protein [Paludibacter sp.]